MSAAQGTCPTCGGRFSPRNGNQRYCNPECQQNRPGKVLARRSRDRAARIASMAQRARRERERAAAAAGDAPAETRQAPLRPAWRLEWHPEIVIRPRRPAPPRYYPVGGVMFDGECAGVGNPLPFRDDINAIADKGSPGRLLPPVALGQARRSVLA